ncbi:MAG: transporter, partial [Desulfuromonadales bacterium]|nr:transporter [Desulfuromonadales bacterium]
MLRFVFLLCLSLSFSLLAGSIAQATSTQFGDTGLLTQPTAQTLNEGNICVGLWANCSDGVDTDSSLSSSSSTIIPATLTMGLGTFMEVYGSYPNLLFNGDEDSSGRGSANVGFKFRVYGKRSDRFRLAVDLQGRRSISDDPDFDGLTDYVSRFIATIKKDTFAIHGNVGYAVNDSPGSIDYDDQVLFGGGVEYSLATRLRLIAEASIESEKISGLGEPSEVSAGLQYFITPHLTMNLGGSVGLSDASPDWRILLGMTTCQGVGTYNRPVPKMVEEDDLLDEQPEPIKVSKIRILTSLIARASVAESPIS